MTTKAELDNILVILRRIRQSSCGKCWASPGRRCWMMKFHPELGYSLPTKRTMLGVHSSRVFRAHTKGVIGGDINPRVVQSAAWWDDHRGIPVSYSCGKIDP